jgi:hypothetical protein
MCITYNEIYKFMKIIQIQLSLQLLCMLQQMSLANVLFPDQKKNVQTLLNCTHPALLIGFQLNNQIKYNIMCQTAVFQFSD